MWLTALKSCWKQGLISNTRYLFNFLSGIITFYMIFAMLFYGAKAVGAGAFNLGSTLEGLFTGYVVWMIIMMGYQDLAWGVTNEAQTGTLEQIYLSPLGYRWIAMFNITVNLVISSLIMFLLVLVMVLTTGQRINLDLFSILPLFAFVYVQAAGLGYALAGLALIFKRVQAFFQIVQFAVIGIFFIPWDRFPWAKYLPFSLGRYQLQRVMMDGVRFWQMGTGEILSIIGVTAVCLGLGLALFAWAEREATSRGLLGQY